MHHAASIGHRIARQRQRAVVGRLQGPGIGHRRGINRQRPAICFQQTTIVDRAGINGQRARRRLNYVAVGQAGAVDRAGPGGVQRAVNVNRAADDAAAGKVQQRAGIHLHHAATIGHRIARQRQRVEVTSTRSVLVRLAPLIELAPVESSVP